jgi:hypothetical protein
LWPNRTSPIREETITKIPRKTLKH